MTRPFRGTLYRAIHPRSDFEPMTGRWSAKRGGRFNRRGREALYTSLSPLTTLKEVARSGRLQPTLVMAYEADLTGIVDASASGLDMAALGDDGWLRDQGPSPSQALAEDLIAAGHSGLLVRSFAASAGPREMNLVLWTWSADTLRVIDDERRLPAP